MSSTALGFAAWNVGASRAAGANGEHTSTRSTQPGILTEFFLFLPLDSCWSVYLPHIQWDCSALFHHHVRCILPCSTICLLKLVFPRRAFANIKILSFSTSQVAFECVWTGIFTVLQIGRVQSLSCAMPSESSFFRDNSGKYLCCAEWPSHVLRHKSTDLDLRFHHYPRSYNLVGRDPP